MSDAFERQRAYARATIAATTRGLAPDQLDQLDAAYDAAQPDDPSAFVASWIAKNGRPAGTTAAQDAASRFAMLKDPKTRDAMIREKGIRAWQDAALAAERAAAATDRSFVPTRPADWFAAPAAEVDRLSPEQHRATVAAAHADLKTIQLSQRQERARQTSRETAQRRGLTYGDKPVTEMTRVEIDAFIRATSLRNYQGVLDIDAQNAHAQGAQINDDLLNLKK